MARVWDLGSEEHWAYFPCLIHTADFLMSFTFFVCRCSAPEQKSITPVGYLQKQTKTAEEKQKELMEDIRKKTEKLSQLDVRRKL